MLVLLRTVFLAEIAVMLWSVPSGPPTVLPPGWVGCITGKKAGTGDRLSYMFIAALVFDSTVFLLTLGRSLYLRATNVKADLVKLIIRDGKSRVLSKFSKHAELFILVSC